MLVVFEVVPPETQSGQGFGRFGSCWSSCEHVDTDSITFVSCLRYKDTKSRGVMGGEHIHMDMLFGRHL